MLHAGVAVRLRPVAERVAEPPFEQRGLARPEQMLAVHGGPNERRDYKLAGHQF